VSRHDNASVTLGQFIRRRRQELGLTQEELAARVGDSVRQSDISRLERDGVSLPRRGRLEQLARALDVSLGTLMRQTGWFDSDDGFAGQESIPTPASHQVAGPPSVSQSHSAPSGYGVLRRDPGARDNHDLGREESAALASALTRAEAVRRRTEAILRQSDIALERARRLRDQQ
jgi:transcriptional regulator with XRE-family HTH domain